MNDLEQRITELERWKKSLENASSIPLNIDQAFRNRFPIRIKVVEKTIDFANLSAGSSTTSTFNVPGAALGDCVAIGIPTGAAAFDNIIFQAHVSATGTVTLRVQNNEATSAINLASEIYKVAVIKQ